MIVVNEEPRIVILGDRVRRGRNPGTGTTFMPGGSVNIADVPEDQRERFVAAVHRAISKGWKLKVFDGVEAVSSEQLQADARKRDAEAALEAGRRALAKVAEDKPKRGPGRPKRALGEAEPADESTEG